jgi:transcriptional regulator with XRE-family HTH domain
MGRKPADPEYIHRVDGTLVQYLQAFMSENEMSITEALNELDVDPSIYYKLCNEQLLPWLPTVEKISDGLGIPIDQLIGHSKEPVDVKPGLGYIMTQIDKLGPHEWEQVIIYTLNKFKELGRGVSGKT